MTPDPRGYVATDVCAERHARIDEGVRLLREELIKVERAVSALDKKLWGGLTLLCLQLAGIVVATLKGCL
jgi:hypothetical protein